MMEMIDQLRNSDFKSTKDFVILDYMKKYLSKWNTKSRSNYGRALGSHGLIEVFDSWLAHFQLQSQDLSKPLLGKMLAVIYEGTKHGGFSDYLRTKKILPKLLRLSWNQKLFNDSSFTEDFLIITFESCWNLYFITVFRPYVIEILAEIYGNRFEGLDVYENSGWGELFQLHRGKMLALRGLTEIEATRRYSFNRSTLMKMRKTFLEKVEFLDQSIEYRLNSDCILKQLSLAYHDILLFFNNLLMSPVNRQHLCDNITYHHYLIAINIFINGSSLTSRKELDRLCLRAIRGLILLQISCKESNKYYSNADKESKYDAL